MEDVMSRPAADELDELASLWPRVSRIISPLYHPSDYERALSLLDGVIDRTGGDEMHPLAPLADFLGLLIEDYENSHVPEPAGDPISALRCLMQEHHIDAGDLRDVAPGADIEEILDRHQPLTVDQIAALSRRFHVSPAVFIPA